MSSFGRFLLRLSDLRELKPFAEYFTHKTGHYREFHTRVVCSLRVEDGPRGGVGSPLS